MPISGARQSSQKSTPRFCRRKVATRSLTVILNHHFAVTSELTREAWVVNCGRAVTTGPRTGIEVLAPGRQDMFRMELQSCFQERRPLCGTAHLFSGSRGSPFAI